MSACLLVLMVRKLVSMGASLAAAYYFSFTTVSATCSYGRRKEGKY